MTIVALAAALAALAVLLWPTRSGPPGVVSPAGRFDAPGDGDRGIRAPGLDDPPVAPLTADDVATSMVLLSLALRSGCGVVQAVEEVAAVAPPAAGRDLRTAAAALRWGADDRTAWEGAGPAWRPTGRAMRLASTAGVPPSAALLAGAQDLRAEELARLEVASARLGVRMVLPLGLTFLPAFGLTTVVPLVVALAASALRS